VKSWADGYHFALRTHHHHHHPLHHICNALNQRVLICVDAVIKTLPFPPLKGRNRVQTVPQASCWITCHTIGRTYEEDGFQRCTLWARKCGADACCHGGILCIVPSRLTTATLAKWPKRMNRAWSYVQCSILYLLPWKSFLSGWT
jgi:hypothetical protein